MEPNLVLSSFDINALPVVEFEPSTSVVEWLYLKLHTLPSRQYAICIQSNADNVFAAYTGEIVCLKKGDRVSFVITLDSSSEACESSAHNQYSDS